MPRATILGCRSCWCRPARTPTAHTCPVSVGAVGCVGKREMTTEPPLLLVLDLVGTFAFGLNGALTAVRTTRLDIVGVLTLGVITAVGGGIIRDVLIGAVPPSTFRDWRYLALAAGGALIAFVASRLLARLETPIVVLDAVGLSVFAVMGTAKALEYGLQVAPAILLGVVTAVDEVQTGIPAGEPKVGTGIMV